MDEAVRAGCLAVAALNLVPALLGLLAFYRGDMSTERSCAGSGCCCASGRAAALALAIAVGSLAAAGHYSDESLFYLYALLPLAIGFVAEQLRVASAQTILDQRGLEGSQAVAALPEAEQHELVGHDHAPRVRRDGRLGARRGVPGAARGEHGARVLSGLARAGSRSAPAPAGPLSLYIPPA